MKYELKSFSKRLSHLIEKRYTTQSDLARKLKMSAALVSLYCTGKKRPSVKRTVEICAILDCSPDWLTKGEGSSDDGFQLSAISNLSKSIPNLMGAKKIGDFIEVKFYIPQNDFNDFMKEARREGCESF